MIGNLLSSLAMSMMVGVACLGNIQADVQPQMADNDLTCFAQKSFVDDEVYNCINFMNILPYNGYPSNIWINNNGNEVYTQPSNFIIHYSFSSVSHYSTYDQFIITIEVNQFYAGSYDLQNTVTPDAIELNFYNFNYIMASVDSLTVLNNGNDITAWCRDEKPFILTFNQIFSENQIATASQFAVFRSIFYIRASGGFSPSVTNFGFISSVFCNFLQTKYNGQGYQSGYTDGYVTGYDKGYQTGESEGYTTGYTTALSELSENHTFMSLFNSIADTPLRFIYGLFNFDIFGTSVLVVVMSLLTAVIIFAIVKKVWK